MGMTFKISTLGCKVNQQESEKLATDFVARGFTPAGKDEKADICVINSCTVTSIADSKTRKQIRQARKENPGAFICVIGCIAETSREAVLAMPEVDIALGSFDKEQTAEIVAGTLGITGEQITGGSSYALGKTRGGDPFHSQRTRAFIKVEDGCDRFCAYCVIPYARGAVRSRTAEDVVTEARTLLEAGYKELVLTGINLALYGSGRPADGSGLYALVKRLCALEAGEEFRVRLGSLEPTVIAEDTAIRIASIKGVCPQFHLSLQSGSEKTLKEMGRLYTPKGYADIVHALREIDPLFSITTDVIVGFPGESDADFEDSLEFVRSMEFAHVHVFKYSKRPGTLAAEMAGQIKEEVKNERRKRMMATAGASAGRFLELNKGHVRRTLIYGPEKSGRFVRGLTDNGIGILLKVKKGEYTVNSFIDAGI